MLWGQLTCMQHLVLFARFKGITDETAETEGLAVLEQLGLADKHD